MQVGFRQMEKLTQLKQPKIIAAIPCCNTEQFIGGEVSKAKKHVDQIIVIDDGSHDDTAEVARAAGALVINHVINKGYGEAIKSCFEAGKANAADVLVILDGDGQHEPDEIPRLLAPILQGEADLTIGSRFLDNEVKIPRYRKFGISVITWLFNLGSRTKVSDAQSGFRAYNKKALETLLLSERRMGISIEILEKARRKGVIIKEVPISCFYPPSSLNLKTIRHGLSVALSVLKIRLKESLFTETKNDE